MTKVLFLDAVDPRHPIYVCGTNKSGEEVVYQSEATVNRAERSVEHLNEHEKLNARREQFYWRVK